jgi:hypothetical protein
MIKRGSHILIVLWLASSLRAAGVEVPRWQPHDFTFATKVIHGNPFDVSMSAQVSGPRGTSGQRRGGKAKANRKIRISFQVNAKVGKRRQHIRCTKRNISASRLNLFQFTLCARQVAFPKNTIYVLATFEVQHFIIAEIEPTLQRKLDLIFEPTNREGSILLATWGEVEHP